MSETGQVSDDDPSLLAFDAVVRAVGQTPGDKPLSPAPARSRTLKIAGNRGGTLRRTAKGVTISLDDSSFADWVESEAQELINDLHARWLQRGEE
jgi:ParB family chromosome partitioning protein